MSDTIFVYAPGLAHTKHHHPESQQRLAGLLPVLEKAGLLSELRALAPVGATREQLERVHTPALINKIHHVSLSGGGLLDRGDTYATAESYNLARIAAGSCARAVDEVMNGDARNGFCLVRPPGHHAEHSQVSGFCLFNNVAVAARQAQHQHGAERILIIDIDVHHGNGTQDIFFADPSVLFMSAHLFAPFFYPGIGNWQEAGRGQGAGYTLNVPLPQYVGDIGYDRIFLELLRPRTAVFQPDLILVSIGFDAHWQVPLASAGLSLTGYARLTQGLITLAEELCHGRVLFILEGGYQIDVLHQGIINTFNALLKKDKISDPFGPMPHPEQDIAALLQKLKEQHLLI